MHCSACATRIQRSLGRLPAVASASVNLATTRAFVSYDPDEAGHRTSCVAPFRIPATRQPRSIDDQPGHADTDPDHWLLRAAISWPLALAALVVALAAPESSHRRMDRAASWPWSSSSPVGGPSCATAPDCCATAPPAWTP